MPQVHKRLNDEIVRRIFNQYDARQLTLLSALAQLGFKRRRFFQLLNEYRDNPTEFSVAYHRTASKQIPLATEQQIRAELNQEKQLLADHSIPIKHYNYSAVRDVLKDKYGIRVSVPTIINRAKKYGCYQKRKPRSQHTQEISTNYAGELVQHDASHHRWSPYATESWTGITSLDDYSRLILFGDLFEHESSIAHISAVESTILHYGCPQKYYVDQHRIFRFVRSRDAKSRFFRYDRFTDESDPQFKQVLYDLGVEPVYALSPQAKGKIERPYQWLQDRTVRRCAKDQISKFAEVRNIFRDEINRYNHRQVHSTTKEIPIRRFERTIQEGRTLFKPFAVPQPFVSTKDVFCLRTKRIVNGYQKISLCTLRFNVPKVRVGQEVSVRIYPELETGMAEVRIWHEKTLAAVQTIKISDLSGVQF